MTGSQPVEGGFTPAQIAQQLVAEGVGSVVIVTDDPSKYAGNTGLPSSVSVHAREAFDTVQRQPGLADDGDMSRARIDAHETGHVPSKELAQKERREQVAVAVELHRVE